MSRSLNKVTLIGNLGADPEIRSTSGGNKVAQFSLATSRQWTSASGEKQEKTEWHKCVAWNAKGSGLADVCVVISIIPEHLLLDQLPDPGGDGLEEGALGVRLSDLLDLPNVC